MAFSKSTRILILLAIDTAFFLLELSVGYAVHSLALVADAFHMLNDVLSLCVGLWAVKVAHSKQTSKEYTYGWQRAETLGALINGVFLVALCLSIFLEAIQRFVEPQTVSNPVLILIVGCFGLLSNILGLFLFHEHGHSHGHSHSHGVADHAHGKNSDPLSNAEQGHGDVQTFPVPSHDAAVADESGNVADILPQSIVGGWPKTKGLRSTSQTADPTTPQHRSKNTPRNNSTSKPLDHVGSLGSDNDKDRRGSLSHSSRRKRRHNSGSRSIFASVDEMQIHPASFRKEIIAQGRLDDIESQQDSQSDDDEHAVIDADATETSPLLGSGSKNSKRDPSDKASKGVYHGHSHRNSHTSPPNDPTHKHTPSQHSDKGQAESHKAHSHADLNMRGVFLHVMGDALGNLGVIGSALFIWLTDYSWRFYADPLISLIITIIILGSAIPLCKAASRILLQAVPPHISVDEIKDDIESLPGIVSCHHLHVWQLSDVKLIASLHVQLEFDFKGDGSARYMDLARSIRQCLHEYGIHSSTIQPEFCLDQKHQHSVRQRPNGQSLVHGSDGANDAPVSQEANARQDNGQSSTDKHATNDHAGLAATQTQNDGCLLECGDECGNSGQCCVPSGTAPSTPLHEQSQS